MAWKCSVVTVVVLSSVLIDFAASIRCYDCNSVNNSMCIDPNLYDQQTVGRFLETVECRQGVVMSNNYDFFCRKIVQTLLYKNHDSQIRVIRGCGWVRADKECYTADNEDHMETVCQCFHDNCNGGPVVQASAWGLLVTVAVVGLKGWILD